jgi:hypothetical protein
MSLSIRSIGVAVCAAPLVPASTAGAGQIASSGGVVTYMPAPGESNTTGSSCG